MIDSKLLTLVTLAEKKSFTRTSKALNLTQPAVSHHISQLETELGVQLVVRNNTQIVFTEEGKIAVEYAKKILGLYDKMSTEVKDSKHHTTNLKIGITHTSESSIIMMVLAKVSTMTPKMNITVNTDTIKNLYDKLDNFEIDLAIIDEKVNLEKYNSLLLSTDSLVCILSKENKLSKKPVLTLEDLKNERMILRLKDSATRMQFDSALISMNQSIDDFDVILEVDNISTIKSLVSKNLGISILARNACISDIRKGKIVAIPIENLSMIRETNIIYNKNNDYSQVVSSIYKTYQETTRAKSH